LNKAKLQSAKQRCAEIENGNGEAKGLGVKLGCSKDCGKGLILEDVAAFFHFKNPTIKWWYLISWYFRNAMQWPCKTKTR
jgi:hypothetical protein